MSTMKRLLFSVVILAAVSCAIGKPTDPAIDEATKKCFVESKMTMADAMDVGKPGYVPSPEMHCFMGCMGQGQDFGQDGADFEKGSDDEKAKTCVKGIKTTEPCEWGRQMMGCAEGMGDLAKMFGGSP